MGRLDDVDLLYALLRRLGESVPRPGTFRGRLALSTMVADVEIRIRPSVSLAAIEDLRTEALAQLEREPWRAESCSSMKGKPNRFGTSQWCSQQVTGAVVVESAAMGRRFMFVCGAHARHHRCDNVVAVVHLGRHELQPLRQRAEREREERRRREDEHERSVAAGLEAMDKPACWARR